MKSNRYLYYTHVAAGMRFPAMSLVVFMLLWGCSASHDVLGPQSGDVTGLRETRPDPPPPAPEIIRFPNGNIELEGTLELPGNDGPYPLLIFVHGSGRTTRASYQSYIPEFQEAGYAIFRYDKRGVGESGGVYSSVGTSNSNGMLLLLATDAVAAIDLLRNHPAVDSAQITLIGASQAGWIIPLAAALTHHVASNVCIVGPTVSVGMEVFYSSLTANLLLSDSAIAAMCDAFTGPFGYDPLTYLYILDQPTLWMYGGNDRSIPTFKSIDILAEVDVLFPKEYTIKLYPEGNHSLVNTNTGMPIVFRPYIVDWLRNVRHGLQFASEEIK